MQNLTVSSFKHRQTEEGMWKAGNLTATHNNPFVPELSMSSNFNVDTPINMIKPILRRTCVHSRNNVLVTWKSFEIQIIRLEYTQEKGGKSVLQYKYCNPVYVPMSELTYLLSLPPSQIEIRVIKSLKLSPNGK